MTNQNLTASQAEPAMIRGVIVAVLTLAGALGLTWAVDVSEETLAAIVLLATLVVPLAQAAWTRHAVTPKAKVVATVTADGRVVAGDAAAEPTGSDVALQPDPADGTVHAAVTVKSGLLPNV